MQVRKLARDFVNSILNMEDGQEVDQSELVAMINNSDLDAETKSEAMKLLYSSIRPMIMKQNHKQVEVINFPSPAEPIEEVRVNNLEELSIKLDQLKEAINNIKIEKPSITVTSPEVNIPAPVVNVPTIDLSLLVNEVQVGLNKIRTNNKSNPLAVRFTDGAEWLKEIKNNSSRTTQYMSDVSYIKDVSGQRVNPATEESIAKVIGEYTIMIDDVSTTGITYIGKATIGSSTSSAVWQIMRLDESGTPITLKKQYANGNNNFSSIYDNRTSLSYS